ncbi:hypothetical protein B7486_08070 [cyanobacterium TDX16]|nr:hypothetical protein B7486_08070 [cyanobacterium TDX16]
MRRLILKGLTVIAVSSTGLALENPATSQPADTQPAEERPSPPTGFKWHEIREIKAAFLMPNGWHHDKLSGKGTTAYRISKEDARGGNGFLTGITVNVVLHCKDKSNIKPSLYAVHHLKEYKEGARVLKEMELDKIGKLTRIQMQVVKRIESADPKIEFRIHVVAIANDETDTLYIITFGAPKADWKTAWKKGKRMVGMFILDDDV